MTWLPPLLLAIIAACAAWIAFQQWVVARQKLNHDLFDRRFAVYVAAKKYLLTCLNKDGGTQEDTSVFYESTKTAPFIFNKDINDFLALVMKHSINIQIFSKHVEMSHLSDWQKHMDIHDTSRQWAADAFGSLIGTFQSSLDLSNVAPFSMKKIVPMPDAQALRDKLATTFKE